MSRQAWAYIGHEVWSFASANKGMLAIAFIGATFAWMRAEDEFGKTWEERRWLSLDDTQTIGGLFACPAIVFSCWWILS